MFATGSDVETDGNEVTIKIVLEKPDAFMELRFTAQNIQEAQLSLENTQTGQTQKEVSNTRVVMCITVCGMLSSLSVCGEERTKHVTI